MRKRILATLLAVCLVLGMVPGRAWAVDVVASGTCGENATWELNDEGTLTIGGEGLMENYSQWTSQLPWYTHLSSIESVAIEQGVTSIGDWAFCGLENLSNISI